MTYQITKTDGTLLANIEDGIVDVGTTSLSLVGRNVVNYGSVQNNNFVHLLENFCNTSEPLAPIAGQLWFNSTSTDQRLYFYDLSDSWNRLPSIKLASVQPTQTPGDLWLNTSTNSLYVSTNEGHVLVGPIKNADTAKKLETPKKINGVDFDGSADITVTSQTIASITAGNYLLGDYFDGSQPVSWRVNASVESAGLSIVARDNQGDIFFNVGHGTSTSARFADLAEKYLIDGEFEIGTVVSVGGPKEVQPCNLGDRAIGVVSANPAYEMNSTLEGGVAIALKGRVPTKISGNIKKGDRLIAGNNGRAISSQLYGYGNVFAIALEDSNGRDVVEALVL